MLVLGTVALFVPTTSIAATDLGTQIAFTGMEIVAVSLATTGVYAAVATIPVVALTTVAVLTGTRRRPVAVVAAERRPGRTAQQVGPRTGLLKR